MITRNENIILNGKFQPAKVDGGGGSTKAITLVSGDVGGK